MGDFNAGETSLKRASGPENYFLMRSFATARGRREAPAAWNVMSIRPIPKTQAPTRVEEFRPVAVSPTILKLLNTILVRRAGRRAATILHECQYSESLLMTTDFSKAYDTVKHAAVSRAVDALFGPTVEKDIVLGQYKDVKAHVKCGKDTSSEFAITRGIRQGDPLAPLIFCVVMAEIVRRLSRSLRVWAYMDDLLLAGTPENLAKGLQELKTMCAGVGLHLNQKSALRWVGFPIWDPYLLQPGGLSSLARSSRRAEQRRNARGGLRRHKRQLGKRNEYSGGTGRDTSSPL